jgi:hypothetical protein
VLWSGRACGTHSLRRYETRPRPPAAAVGFALCPSRQSSGCPSQTIGTRSSTLVHRDTARRCLQLGSRKYANIPYNVRHANATCNVRRAACIMQRAASCRAHCTAWTREMQCDASLMARHAGAPGAAGPAGKLGLAGPPGRSQWANPTAPLHHPLLVSRVLRVPSRRLFCVLLGDASFPSRLPRATGVCFCAATMIAASAKVLYRRTPQWLCSRQLSTDCT